MKRLWMIALVALAAAPAALASGSSTSSAQAQCSSLKVTMGAATFAQTYSSFGACVSKLAPIDRANAASARSSCQTEQSDVNFAGLHGGKTFTQFYGAGKGKNAFGRCVSTKEQASAAAEKPLGLNPAKTCESSRTSMGADAFAKLYGTFGKCVSKVAQAQLKSEINAAAQCRIDEAATSATQANAFGQCVAQETKAGNAEQQQATATGQKNCSSGGKPGTMLPGTCAVEPSAP